MLNPLDVFANDGPLASNVQSYSVRKEQIEFADAVTEAIAGQESLICEAGTGTGKTFAYLVPAILSGKKIIISTGTRHLQDQLFYKDLPVISRALRLPVKTAILKGRSNYLCKHRLVEYEKGGHLLSESEQHTLTTIRNWLPETSSGDLTELVDLPENSTIKSLITSTTDNCLGQECEFYDECFILNARRRAAEAELVIVNHHLLMADLSLRETGFGEILPRVDFIIFDEAHQLPDLAAEFFGTTFSSRQLIEISNDCRAAYQHDANDIKGFVEIPDSILVEIKKFRQLLGKNDRRIAWQEISMNKAITHAVNQLYKRLDVLEQALDKLSSRSRTLESCWRRVGNLMTLLKDFCERENEEYIQWLEIRGSGFLLHQTPLDVSQVFQQRLSQYECECIYTSATLAVKDDFSHFAGQLGLDGVKSHAWPSPFDYRKQSLLYLPPDMPDPGQVNYTSTVVNISLAVIEASKGHAFILFTSHKALQEAATLITNKLDYPVFVQGQLPRTELLERFRNTANAVLLGTNSFWEGVDVRGKALSCVIIDKLPFASPDDPVFQARAAKMQANGINPFLDYQMPQAIINLKQGVGRLIRDMDDYGVLTLCDPRLSTKGYGKKFLDSLPPINITSDIADVRNFYDKRIDD